MGPEFSAVHRSHDRASRLFLAVLTSAIFSLTVPAQQQRDVDFPLDLPLKEFVLTRSLGNDIVGGSEAFRFKKTVFRRKRIIPKPTRKKPVANTAGKSLKYTLPAADQALETWENIGITLWKASTNAPKASDEIARLSTRNAGEIVPVRVGPDTIFNRGDQVRISVESPRKGYLYIIDREILADDNLGQPYQIFPTMLAHNGNNKVQSGVVMDIPAQNDRSPFFNMGSTTPGYRGEMLTVIVSPVPLTDFSLPKGQVAIATDLADEMENRYATEVGEYEQEGTGGKAYTTAEKAAGANVTRQLTQGDPYPQTVYRVKANGKTPILINLRLSVK